MVSVSRRLSPKRSIQRAYNMGGLSLFSTILTVVAVLLLAYWCSRLLAKQGMKTSGTRNMKVLEHIQVGQDRMILLLKVGEHTYLVGASQAGISLLTEVEGEFEADMPLTTEDTPLSSFQTILKEYLSRQLKKDGEKDE